MTPSPRSLSGNMSVGKPKRIGAGRSGGSPQDAQAAFCRRRHQPRRPPISHADSPSISVALRPLRLRTIHRAENIASALKRGVNVCQRQFVNEVLGPLVTKFIRTFGGEDATPIQPFPTAAFLITSRLVKLVRHSPLPQASRAALEQMLAHVGALSTKSNVEAGRSIRSAESAQPNRGLPTSGSPGWSPPSRRQIRT